MRWALKRLMYLLLFSGVIFIPYAIIHSGSASGDSADSNQVSAWQRVTGWFSNTTDSLSDFFVSDKQGEEIGMITQESMLSVNPQDDAPHLDGGAIDKLSDVFRFDVSPKWITQRWARVSTEIHSDALQGYRVPIVTGEQLDDLAGSLTYYFDRGHQIQRIEFSGFTGDPARIVSLMEQEFHLTQRPTTLAGLYIKSQNRRPVSVLRIVRPTVVNADTAHSQFKIQFELNRPAIGAQLSSRYRTILNTDHILDKI